MAGSPDTRRQPRPTEMGLTVISDLSTPNRRAVLIGGGVLLLDHFLGGCASPVPGQAGPGPDASSTPRTEAGTSSVSSSPRATEPVAPARSSLQVPLAEWRPETDPSDPSRPLLLAEGARIKGLRAVEPGRYFPDISVVSKGDLAYTESEPNPGDFSDIQIDGEWNPDILGDDAEFWIAGGKSRIAFQNDDSQPCARTRSKARCGSTYTSTHVGTGPEAGFRVYSLVSAPASLNGQLGDLAGNRTTVQIEDLPAGVRFHDSVRIYRK